MTPKKKIFIVAGNPKEFEDYQRKKLHEWTEYGGELEGYFPEYVYVSNANQLKGLNEIEGYYIGSYEDRTDLDEITWCIKAIKARKTIEDVQKGSNGISGKFASTIINDEFQPQPAITVAVGTMLPVTMLPIGSGGTISNINTTVTTQYSYPNPNLEQRTKALEEALEEIKTRWEIKNETI